MQICSICRLKIKDGVMIGTGEGSGNSFAHKECYDEIENTKDKTLEDMVFINLSCTEELTKEFIKIALEDIQTFDKKQHDYGSDNIGDFGEFGVLVRANDKMQRLKNLLNVEETTDILRGSGENPLNEPIKDSWLDLSVYGIIARMCRNGIWPK